MPKADPPEAAANQLKVPADAVAPNVTVPVPQLLPGVVAVTVGLAFTVATTAVLEVDVHELAVAST